MQGAQLHFGQKLVYKLLFIVFFPHNVTTIGCVFLPAMNESLHAIIVKNLCILNMT